MLNCDLRKMNYITISIGQITLQNLIKESGLPVRRILFDKSCLQRIFFHQESGQRRMILIKDLLLNHSGVYLI